MKIPQINTNKYTYSLPDDKIAKYPLNNRSDSKLLIYKTDIQESNFTNIGEYLPKESLLIFNNTKVIQARIPFTKTTGAKIEIFCLEPTSPADINLAFQSKISVRWKCIVGNSKKWKEGSLNKIVQIDDNSIDISVERKETLPDAQIIEFSWNNSQYTFSDILEIMGNIPIPPYLNRASENIDLQRYQTVYSQHKGSVAAPTAGLHFTDKILKKLSEQGIKQAYVTLHVGAGTFKPIKTNTIAEHEMHIEHFVVEQQTIEKLLGHKGKIVCTGTTSVRTVESLYWLGVKILEDIDEFFISQWDPYNLPKHYSQRVALEALKTYLTKKDRQQIASHTKIIIVPGYDFKITNALITNFHQPNSTLLMLIAAFTGEENWKTIYDYALKNNFRFLSYGDSSLLFHE